MAGGAAWVMRRRWWVVAGLLAVLAAQLMWVSREYTATWDEAHHLYDGYTVLTRRDFRLNPEVPPLVKVWAALPLLGERLAAPANQGRDEPREAFLDGRAFVFGNGVGRTLARGRAMCAVFAVVLGLLLYVAGAEMFGVGAGLVALGMWVWDPNVLANGALVTTDVASGCCFFGTVYAFWRYCERPGWGRLLGTGLVLGLALVTKFTGVLLGPVLLLLSCEEGVRLRSWRVAGQRIVAVLGAGAVGYAVIWAAYGFRYRPVPELTPPLEVYLRQVPKAGDAAMLGWMGRRHLLPEPYLWGLANTKVMEWQYVSYFFGRIYRHGPWMYFPAAFLIKSTLPLLLLLVVAAVLWRTVGRGREVLFLLVPVVVYFGVIVRSHFDIGARHLLPVWPFLYVLAGAAAVAAWGRGGVGRGAVVVLLGWQVVTSVRVAPAYMSYGNEAWGGPGEVHRYLSDANVDWGQQLKAVKQYLAKHQVGECWFAYFPDGAVEPEDYGVNCRRLPTGSGTWWFQLPMEVPPVIEGTVLISDSDLEGVEGGDGPWLNPYDGFRGLKPDAVIQGGVDVYKGRFAVPLAAAWVRTRESQRMAAEGRADEALRMAKEAATWAPGSALVQVNLAERLADTGQWSEAAAVYGRAGELVRTVRPDLQEEEMGPRVAKGLAEAREHLHTGG